MKKTSFSSQIFARDENIIIHDPSAGTEKIFEEHNSIETEPPDPVELEWYEKGWLHSYVYIAGDRFRRESEIPFEDFQDAMIHTEREIEWKELTRALLKRRSLRRFSKKPIGKSVYESLIQTMNESISSYPYFRFIVIPFSQELENKNLPKIEKNTDKKIFEKVNIERRAVSQLISGMPASLSAAVTIFLICDLKIASLSFQEGLRLRRIYIEAGEIFQRILVHLSRLEVYGVPSPAIDDIETKNILQIDNASEWPLYSLALGYEEK